MKKLLLLILFTICLFPVYASYTEEVTSDTAQVNKLNDDGYAMRKSDPEQTIAMGTKALKLAQDLKFQNGIGESYRVIGVGRSYNDEPEKAIESYLNALTYFLATKNLSGQAKVYNNIGNLYRDNDFEKALEYLRKSLQIAQALNNENLIASLYLNIGNVYYRQKNFYAALTNYQKSDELFKKLKNQEFEVTCMQNIGVIYFNLGQYDKAENLLLKSNEATKAANMPQQIASIDLTLSSLYIAKGDFDKAEKFVEEGISYAEIVKGKQLLSDFTYTSYQLEVRRKNYEKALRYLQKIYTKDSTDFQNYVSARIKLLQIKHRAEAKEQENANTILKQKNDRYFFFGVTAVAILLVVVIILLTNNIKRKALTNQRLTDLNSEVSRQKDNLDRVNHHLEEIIDERTKDLQVKNKKLSEYSSYLSHQIRGPIATLKGLINLEKEGLVNKEECFNMMDKCVSEIDNKIMDMSDMLHDPERTSMLPE
ncbi:tetratricopeptide repeat protein [Mucilaginibacter ginkgonis]|uniref:Tetratricopeptide repeat protein n=1 Tax=Mucilaginibacter ginkgonis TaxID=2682091 RepID=A0A6I4I1N8_9SPHI|nr:tetratricopeptide repeat protein [Mucilaginibacter ginkgonis]QQL50671.1 tetratricopeptide repeat protein [Mucilaginibacter ginkgonis]